MAKVMLLAHTPDPEKVVAMAAKLCYSSSDIQSLNDSLDDEKVKSFVDMLCSIGHESPVEHVTFTFGIEGISRSCSHQLVRHRIASYSQKSQRYVSENQFEYITPPAIQNNKKAYERYTKLMNTIQEEYDAISNLLLTQYLYEEKGIWSQPINKLTKKAIEDARFVLPNACETKIVVTMNVRSLFNFFRHRCCNRAQWEIRAVAEEMYKLCMDVAPNLFKHTGPSCVATGKCPEGKMSCGKITEVKDKYQKFLEELDHGD